MAKKWLLLLVLAALLTGCEPVESLNPLYTTKDVITDAKLEGEWVSPDPSDGLIRISALGHYSMTSHTRLDGYTLAIIDNDGSTAKFDAFLINLDGHMFLDVVPDAWDARSDSYTLHFNQGKSGASIEPRLIKLGMMAYMEFVSGSPEPSGQPIEARLRQAHWFFKVAADGKKLRLDWMDDEKIKKAVEGEKVKVANALLDVGKSKDIVIVADTKELQKFALDHVNDETLFSEHTEWQRRPAK